VSYPLGSIFGALFCQVVPSGPAIVYEIPKPLLTLVCCRTDIFARVLEGNYVEFRTRLYGSRQEFAVPKLLGHPLSFSSCFFPVLT
jgi:hypothetical protein